MTDKTKLCPILRKPCVEHDCAWFRHITGLHPQTGEHIDRWDCAVPWLMVVGLEQSKHTLHAGAAVESLRNEVARSREEEQLARAGIPTARLSHDQIKAIEGAKS